MVSDLKIVFRGKAAHLAGKNRRRQNGSAWYGRAGSFALGVALSLKRGPELGRHVRAIRRGPRRAVDRELWVEISITRRRQRRRVARRFDLAEPLERAIRHLLAHLLDRLDRGNGKLAEEAPPARHLRCIRKALSHGPCQTLGLASASLYSNGLHPKGEVTHESVPQIVRDVGAGCRVHRLHALPI